MIVACKHWHDYRPSDVFTAGGCHLTESSCSLCYSMFLLSFRLFSSYCMLYFRSFVLCLSRVVMNLSMHAVMCQAGEEKECMQLSQSRYHCKTFKPVRQQFIHLSFVSSRSSVGQVFEMGSQAKSENIRRWAHFRKVALLEHVHFWCSDEGTKRVYVAFIDLCIYHNLRIYIPIYLYNLHIVYLDVCVYNVIYNIHHYYKWY